jgi:hypothetical protein
MIRTRTVLLTLAWILGLLTTGTWLDRGHAWQKVERGVPKEQRTLALGEDEVKQLIGLMDADKNGMISKQEFMKFMEAEFDRLDKDKSGQLDQKELTQSLIRPARPAAGK